jgi:hypothetical protein
MKNIKKRKEKKRRENEKYIYRCACVCVYIAYKFRNEHMQLLFTFFNSKLLGIKGWNSANANILLLYH